MAQLTPAQTLYWYKLALVQVARKHPFLYHYQVVNAVRTAFGHKPLPPAVAATSWGSGFSRAARQFSFLAGPAVVAMITDRNQKGLPQFR